MCLGVPAQVVAVVDREDRRAVVDVDGVRREVSTALLEGSPAPGDWVLLHVGFALAPIAEEEALATLAALREALG